MRGSGSAGMAAILMLSATTAIADTSGSAEPELGNAADSLPGIVRVAAPTELERGVALSVLAGYAFTESVVETDDVHHRANGTLGISYRVADWIGFGLKLDARLDRHDLEMASDQTFISDPRLIARVARRVNPNLSLGAQTTAWFPGDGPGEFTFSAASLDVLAIATYRLSPQLALAFNGGFRLDRSAESVVDESALSDSDRLALGVSDSNAVLAGVGASYSISRFELLGEWTWDVLVGSEAPSLRVSPMRLSGGVRYHATNTAQLDLRFDLAPNRRPILGAGEPFVPVEPLIGVMLGLNVRFPTAPDTPTGGGTIVVAPQPKQPKPKQPPKASARRTLRGLVKGNDGEAISKAQVEVAAGAKVTLLVTDGGGSFVAEKLPSNKATVQVTAAGFKTRTAEVQLSEDGEVELEFVLEPAIANGQLRGVVAAYSGAPLPATVSVPTANSVTETDGDGAFRLTLPVGDHTVIITSGGYQEQTRVIKVEENEVTVLNIDLRKLRNRKR